MYRLLFALLCLFPVSTLAGGLVGVAYVDNLVGPNLEWAFTSTSVYVVPGVRFSQKSSGAKKDDVRFVGGARMSIDRGRMDQSGFYVGFIAGDFSNSRHYKRNGYGGELGYHLVKTSTRWTLGGALVVRDSDAKRNLNNEPYFTFTASVSIR